MKSKWFVLVSLVVLSSLVLSACGGAGGGGNMKTEIGEGEGEVSIVAWPFYIERGENDPAYDWVTEFEAQTGCKVTVKTAATSDEMVSLMNEGGFDLVTASGDASNRLIAAGTLQEVNIDLIPSWGTVDNRLKEAAWHTVDGKHYGVPYQWGPNVLMYNTGVFPEPPTSWDVTFVEMTLPDGQTNKNRVQAYDGPIYLADAALYLKYHNPELGIDNPYDLNQAQFDAVVALLTEQRALINRYWHDAAVQMDDFVNEGVVASGSWPFQVNFMAEGVNVSSVFPVEGVTGWADTTMMHVNAPHPNCAYKWMEWSLNPKLQGDLSAWFGSNPAVDSVCNGGGSQILDEAGGCAVNGFDKFDTIWFWRTPTAECSDSSGGCVPYSKWVEAYVGIISK